MSDGEFSGWGCPRCGTTPLGPGDEALLCDGCGARYPRVGSLPCLVPDPDAYRALWSGRLERYRAVIQARTAALEVEASAPHLLERTRARVHRLAASFQADLATIEELFGPLLPGAGGASPLAQLANDGSSPVLQCCEHLHRDWCWGERESEAALDVVRALAPEPGRKTVVLGVGTGRLAADIQRELRPAFTLGLDQNPLPLLASSALFAGRTVELHEYPVAPLSADETAILRRLVSPYPAPPGLHLALANALAAPLAPASVDLVVTPWLIDAIGVDPRVTCRAVARLLPVGGIWANFGPLRFEGAVSTQLSIDELLELVAASGFEIVQSFRRDVPYFDSPHSGSRRTDTVFAFAARRATETAELPIPEGPAPWLRDTTLPVPALPTLASERTRFLVAAGVFSMVNGARSIRDLAQVLANDRRMPVNVLEAQLVELFSRFAG